MSTEGLPPTFPGSPPSPPPSPRQFRDQLFVLAWLANAVPVFLAGGWTDTNEQP